MARVLLVEPDAGEAAEVLSALEEVPVDRVRLYGTKPTLVRDAAAGLDALREPLRWELVIADVVEASRDDWRFVRALRERFTILEVPLVVLAPFRPGPTVRMRGQLAGVNLWARRPLDRGEFARLLLTLCEGR